MGFILRSVFWLSLVFYALPDTADIPAVAIRSVVGSATDSLTDLCKQNPQGCLNALAKLAAIDPELIPASLSAPAAEIMVSNPAQKSSKSVPKDKIGPLIDNDLTPGWRGQRAKM